MTKLSKEVEREPASLQRLFLSNVFRSRESILLSVPLLRSFSHSVSFILPCLLLLLQSSLPAPHGVRLVLFQSTLQQEHGKRTRTEREMSSEAGPMSQ